ncbi:hypothetical protein PTKIN_Ptkin18bG0027500 [Pterospermum kingtungense]
MVRPLTTNQLQQFGFAAWYLWSLHIRELHGEKRPASSVAIAKYVWTRPRIGLIKISFDAAYDKCLQTGGVGIIVRDHDGFVLAAKVLKISKVINAFHAEALALFMLYDLQRMKVSWMFVLRVIP